MVVGRVRSLIDPVARLPEPRVWAPNEVGGSSKDGNPTGNGSPKRPPLEHARQRCHQPLVPRRIERLKELTPRLLSAAGQKRLDVLQRVPALPVGFRTPLPNRVDLDVEVPNGTQGLTGPLEFISQT